MFKRKKTEKTEKPKKQKKDVAALFELQRASLSRIDEALADAEATTDAAEKILKLQNLQYVIQNGRSQAHYKQEDIVDKRTTKKYYLTGLGGAYGTAAAAAVPICILAPPLLPLALVGGLIGLTPSAVSLINGHMKETKRKKLAEQNPGLDDFATTLAAREERVTELLDEAVKSCDFKQTWLSPHFGKALGECTPLRERFAEAVIDDARRANEEKAAAEPDVAEPAKPRKAPRPANKLKVTR